jgi:hypothetical protein
MSDYIDLAVVGKVIAAGLLFGAVLPLVFATGLRALSADTGDTASYRERLPGHPQPGRTRAGRGVLRRGRRVGRVRDLPDHAQVVRKRS